MHPSARPIRKPSVIKQQVDDTSVLLDVVSGAHFAIEGVGGRVWDLCDGHHSLAEIATVLAREFDAPRAVIERDLAELMAVLEHERLVEESRGTP